MDDRGRCQAKEIYIKAKAEGGSHISAVVQLSWHKGPVAGVWALSESRR